MYQQRVSNMFCFVIVAFAELLISQVPYCNKAGAPLCHRCTSREQSMWDLSCMIYEHCSAPCWAIFYLLCGTTAQVNAFFLHHGRSMLNGGFYGMIQLTTLSTMTIGTVRFSNAGYWNGGWMRLGQCRLSCQAGEILSLPSLPPWTSKSAILVAYQWHVTGTWPRSQTSGT